MKETNQLPPELVEKMFSAISKHHITMNIPELAEQCAKIAVDYANEYKYRYNIQFAVNEELRSQRDELLGGLKKLKEGNMMSHSGDEIAKQLIQKYDGK